MSPTGLGGTGDAERRLEPPRAPRPAGEERTTAPTKKDRLTAAAVLGPLLAPAARRRRPAPGRQDEQTSGSCPGIVPFRERGPQQGASMKADAREDHRLFRSLRVEFERRLRRAAERGEASKVQPLSLWIVASWIHEGCTRP